MNGDIVLNSGVDMGAGKMVHPGIVTPLRSARSKTADVNRAIRLILFAADFLI